MGCRSDELALDKDRVLYIRGKGVERRRAARTGR